MVCVHAYTHAYIHICIHMYVYVCTYIEVVLCTLYSTTAFAYVYPVGNYLF